jgi:hypothetical protein
MSQAPTGPGGTRPYGAILRGEITYEQEKAETPFDFPIQFTYSHGSSIPLQRVFSSTFAELHA